MQHVLNTRGRHHHRRGSRVKTPKQRIPPGQGNLQGRVKNFRELGVESRAEIQTMLVAIPAGGPPQRSLSGNMDPVRPEIISKSGEFRIRLNGQVYAVITRTRTCLEQARVDNQDIQTHVLELSHQLHQRCHHPVHLRFPGIGDQQQAIHAASTCTELTAEWACSRQWMTSRRPSCHSTSALKLSTQSPSLQ